MWRPATNYTGAHGAGSWLRPVICPARGYYGCALWLWDTAFHVHGLLTSKGPLGLAKALDQLGVLLLGGLKVGHLPAMVGTDEVKIGTQPPGVLTWAAYTAYSRTGGMGFPATAYKACALNSHWYYNAPAGGRGTTAPSGLVNWGGVGSGWDNSPRWGHGIV